MTWLLLTVYAVAAPTNATPSVKLPTKPLPSAAPPPTLLEGTRPARRLPVAAIKTAPVLVATVAAPSVVTSFSVPVLTRVSPP